MASTVVLKKKLWFVVTRTNEAPIGVHQFAVISALSKGAAVQLCVDDTNTLVLAKPLAATDIDKHLSGVALIIAD